MPAFSASVTAWRERGRMFTLCGREVFVLDAGLPASETVLLLHGFPTSSHDFHRVLPMLGAERRVVTLDLPGFGFSEKPAEYSYSLFEQADIVTLALRELGVTSCHVVAHDMGTSVATELLARRERGLLPFDVRSLVLSNGSVHIELAHLTPSQKLLRTRLGPLVARHGSGRVFKTQMRRIVGKPLADADLDDMWALLRHRDGQRRLPLSISYIAERHRFWHRWIGALERLDLATLVLWGPLDTVAVPAIATRLAAEIPGARLEWLDGLGHYPHLEDPGVFAAALKRFLDGGRRA